MESQTGLYVFFKTVCDQYDLLPAENYKLPPEAEGLEAPPIEAEADKPPPAILKPASQQRPAGTEDDGLHPGGRTNTRRHIRSSPSTGSAVTTVIEADEEDTDNVSNKMESLHISDTRPTGQEPESAEVPVIVERSVMEGASKSEEQHPPEPVEPPAPAEAEVEAEAEAEAEEANQTIVEPELASNQDEDQNEESNIPLPSPETDTRPSEPHVEESSSETKTDDEESKQPTDETAPDPSESTEKEKEPAKETKSEDMAGESGHVPDPE